MTYYYKGAALTSQSIINDLPVVGVYYDKLNPCSKGEGNLPYDHFITVKRVMAGIFKNFHNVHETL